MQSYFSLPWGHGWHVAQCCRHLPCGQAWHFGQCDFILPWGHGLHAGQLPFTLPCGQGLHWTHLRLTLPCGQPVHKAQLFRSAVFAPDALRAVLLRRPCWHCTRSHAIARARSRPARDVRTHPGNGVVALTTASLGFLSESETTRRGAPSSSCAELAARHNAPARVARARVRASERLEHHGRRQRTPRREGDRRPPGDRPRRGFRGDARALSRDRARHRVVSSPGAHVRVRRTRGAGVVRRTRHRTAVRVRARRVQPGPAVRHRGGFDAVSPGARRGTRERRVRRNARRQVRGVRAARARGRESRGRQDCLGARVRDARIDAPLEKTFEFESHTYTRWSLYPAAIPPRWSGRCTSPSSTPSQTSARAPRTPGAPKPPPPRARACWSLLKTRSAAAETRDAAARQAAAAVLLEVEAARAAAADASHRLGALENPGRATPRRRFPNGATTRRHSPRRTARRCALLKSSRIDSSFINVTKHFRRFARKHTRAVWGVLEAARRDARATRGARRARRGKDAWVKNRKNTLFQNTLTDGFIRALVVAPWRLARFTVRSSSFAWHVVMWAYVVLARVVPARYRVAAGLAAAVAARRASRPARQKKKKTRLRTPPVIRLSAKRGSVWTRPCCVNCARCGAKPPSARCSSPTLARSRDEKTSQKNSNTKQPRRKRRFATRRAPKKKQSAPIVVARPARRHVAREKNTFRTIGG